MNTAVTATPVPHTLTPIQLALLLDIAGDTNAHVDQIVFSSSVPASETFELVRREFAGIPRSYYEVSGDTVRLTPAGKAAIARVQS
jgi:phosphohistidine phosphatase SixA